MIIILTDKERDHFAAWLEQGAASDNGMAKIMEESKSVHMEPVIKMLRIKAAARLLIAKEIRSTETMALSSSGEEE